MTDLGLQAADDGFTGSIRGLRLYNRALSTAELSTLHDNGTTTSGPIFALLTAPRWMTMCTYRRGMLPSPVDISA